MECDILSQLLIFGENLLVSCLFAFRVHEMCNFVNLRVLDVCPDVKLKYCYHRVKKGKLHLHGGTVMIDLD